MVRYGTKSEAGITQEEMNLFIMVYHLKLLNNTQRDANNKLKGFKCTDNDKQDNFAFLCLKQLIQPKGKILVPGKVHKYCTLILVKNASIFINNHVKITSCIYVKPIFIVSSIPLVYILITVHINLVYT